MNHLIVRDPMILQFIRAPEVVKVEAKRDFEKGMHAPDFAKMPHLEGATDWNHMIKNGRWIIGVDMGAEPSTSVTFRIRSGSSAGGFTVVSPPVELAPPQPPRPQERQEAGEWVTWGGGDCPIPDGVSFEVRTATGVFHAYRSANEHIRSWKNWHDGYITAYRIKE